MSEHGPVGSTVRNWDLPDDGASQHAKGTDSGWERVADAVWNAAGEWPAEIEMCNGPNIIVHSREEYDYIRQAAQHNARLAARNEP